MEVITIDAQRYGTDDQAPFRRRYAEAFSLMPIEAWASAVVVGSMYLTACTPGGVGGLVPSVYNKHAFVTGRETGGQS